MTQVSVPNTRRLVFGALIAICAFGTACIPSQAADLGSDFRSGARHVRAGWDCSSWRDRCAWAGYYCLYAWDGYITGITATDGRAQRELSPLVAAESAPHSRLSEL
jgi:hypothetical protein